MLPKGFEEAILEFAAKVGEGVSWAVDGSAALCLQGTDVVPADVDILTDRRGAYVIAERLKDHMVRPVTFSKTERYESHFGVLTLQNVRFELMGDLRVFRNGAWTKTMNPASAKLSTVKVRETTVPVLSMDYLRETGYLEERLRRTEVHRGRTDGPRSADTP